VLPGGGALLGEFLADEQVSGHCPIEAHPATVANRPALSETEFNGDRRIANLHRGRPAFVQ
jgi:hypothetical protein